MSKKDIIRELALKYKVSEEEVERAAGHQYKFANEQMSKDSLPSIRLPYFGIFEPNKRKLKHIKQHNDKRNEQKS